MIQREGCNIRVALENGMHGAPQVPDAFAVDDPHLKNPTLAAGGKVVRHKVLHFPRSKRVQVEHANNRKFNRSIHIQNLSSFRFVRDIAVVGPNDPV